MKPSSCKQKGRKFQKLIAQHLSDCLGIPCGKDEDIESRPMGQSGSDIILHGDAKKLFPFGVECKCVENLSIWKALKQAEEYGDPILFFTRNRTPEYCAIRADSFFEMYSELLKLRDKEIRK